jgi:hypothetical protein
VSEHANGRWQGHSSYQRRLLTKIIETTCRELHDSLLVEPLTVEQPCVLEKREEM